MGGVKEVEMANVWSQRRWSWQVGGEHGIRLLTGSGFERVVLWLPRDDVSIDTTYSMLTRLVDHAYIIS